MKIFSILLALLVILLYQQCGNLESASLEVSGFSTESSSVTKSAALVNPRLEVPLFESMADRRRRYFYRIPSLVVVNNNQYLVAFAEQRVASNEDSGDINVVYRISFDHGKNWTKIFKACEMSRDTCGNPTAVVDQKTGIIHLFMMSNPGHKAQNHPEKPRFEEGDRRVLYRQAHFVEQELKWTAIEDLTDSLQPSGTRMDVIGPGVGIQLGAGPHKGRLIVPAAHRSFISDNGGRNWRMSNTTMPRLSSESSVVELDNGRILRNDRSMGRNRCQKDEDGHLVPGSVLCRRSISFSNDQGDRFTTPSIDNRLFDPIAQGSMLKYATGHIFFANCSSTVRRRNLVIQKTLDGKTWFSKNRIDASCGYSSMAKTRDYHLAILYERKGKNAHLWDGKVPQDLIFKKFKLNDLK